MLDKDSCIPKIISRLEKIERGEKVELRPYKRNRVVSIEKIEGDEFKIVEDGFYKEVYRVSKNQLQKALKRILKKEFPRSHKIRVYVLSREEKSPQFKKL